MVNFWIFIGFMLLCYTWLTYYVYCNKKGIDNRFMRLMNKDIKSKFWTAFLNIGFGVAFMFLGGMLGVLSYQFFVDVETLWVSIVGGIITALLSLFFSFIGIVRIFYFTYKYVVSKL